MNAKEMAQASDNVRMGAIKRRIQKPPPPQPKQDENKDVVDDRKNMGY